ncbi:MAG: TPM domain-containing protein [Acetivibrionales bacterium]|jgi:uncharacterized protein
MKKRIITIFTLLFLVVSFVTVFAERDLPLLVDDADLLTDREEKLINSKLERISKNQKCEVAILTVYSLDGKTATEYADDFFDYNGYGYGYDDDGILLLISMEHSDWAMSTHGYAITAFTDKGLDYIADEVLPYLSDEEYKDAFSRYAELCDELLTQAREGSPYGAKNASRSTPEKAISPKRIFISLGVGLLFAFIITGIMKGKLKSVRYQPAATSYVRKDSLNIAVSKDLFLYRKVDRRAIPKNNSSGSSTHRSSSGRTHGGSSGKF